jgi:hypothetical protein
MVSLIMKDHEKSIYEYISNLKLTREIIVDLISKLEKISAVDKEDEKFVQLYGEKCDVVSALTKLSSILIKIIPMERDLMDSIKSENGCENVGRIINSDDREIIKRYIKKYCTQTDA